MKYLRRLFRKPKPVTRSQSPPLVMRHKWDANLEDKLHKLIHYGVLDVLGELTEEERKAHQTRELGTPSEPTLHDVNYTQLWSVYTAVTARIATYWVYID